MSHNELPQILKITKTNIGAEEVNSVNSRDIYEYLGISTEYSHWIKRAIEKYEFRFDEDYLTNAKKDGRQTLIDYIVTMDMAKELCMVSNTEKGKEVRKYFIAVEKEANKPLSIKVYLLLFLLL